MIYVVCGPTGSGKTELALKMANYLNCKIINADAFQIYKNMDIGTAKVNDPESLNIHYLIDILSPDEDYSIKQYQTDFRKVLSLENDKNFIVCGGSGLYIKSALYDYDFPEYNDDISDLEKLNNNELIELLQKLDPDSAKKVHENNRKRVIHAISLARSGFKKSDIISKQNHQLIRDDVIFIFINPDREKLYSNIDNRVDKMFENGLLDEVIQLNKNFKLSKTAREAIGYKETLLFIDKQISFEECKDLIKKRTRNYAKRQITFFKHQLPTNEFKNIEDAYEGFINGNFIR